MSRCRAFSIRWCRNLAIDDRIDLYAAGEGGAHAVLIVDSIGPDQDNRVKVSVLQEFKRQ